MLISSKLKKIVLRDPENLVETLEKCAQITKFSEGKVSTSTENED